MCIRDSCSDEALRLIRITRQSFFEGIQFARVGYRISDIGHAVQEYAEMCIRDRGMHVGVKVTLRQDRMWEFLDRLFNIALPRVRDFRGVNANAFDGRGNYALGIKEQLIFPEISYDKIDKVRGMDVIFVTTAKTDEEARELLTLLGMPFAK